MRRRRGFRTVIPANQTFPFLGPYTPGIDVSHFQGAIDWARVKAGIQFAYLKATDGAMWRDPQFRSNVESCADLGIPWGAYHFFRPSQDPGSQAENFNTFRVYSAIGPIILPQLPPVLDVEVAPVTLAQLEYWLGVVSDAQHLQPIVYCSPTFARQYLPSAALDGGFFDEYPLWVAEYTTNPVPDTAQWEDWEFWQHTPHGQVDGISTPVDLDWFHGTLEDLKARFSIKST